MPLSLAIVGRRDTVTPVTPSAAYPPSLSRPPSKYTPVAALSCSFVWTEGLNAGQRYDRLRVSYPFAPAACHQGQQGAPRPAGEFSLAPGARPIGHSGRYSHLPDGPWRGIHQNC